MDENITTRRLTGRVATILSPQELAINIGSKSGVRTGFIFAVLAEAPIEVRDPESGALLDTIDREKVRVYAYEIREHITICKTYRHFASISSIMGTLSTAKIMSDALNSPRQESLRIAEDAIPPQLSEEQRYVRVNDRVMQVFE